MDLDLISTAPMMDLTAPQIDMMTLTGLQMTSTDLQDVEDNLRTSGLHLKTVTLVDLTVLMKAQIASVDPGKTTLKRNVLVDPQIDSTLLLIGDVITDLRTVPTVLREGLETDPDTDLVDLKNNSMVLMDLEAHFQIRASIEPLDP